MTEAQVGRLLSACLHQAIADELPDRLEFYEHWLRSDTLHGSAIGPAALSAVTGFLRTEGQVYDAVMTRAGQLASEWHVQSVSGFKMRAIRMLPSPLRARAALKLATSLVRSVSGPTRASGRLRRSEVRLDVVESPFCQVRERPPGPLCVFYLAVMVGTLRQFNIASHGRVDRCSAVDDGGGECVVVVELDGTMSVVDQAVAA